MSALMERLGQGLPTRYRLIREIGRGGAAHVFLAHELHPRRDVAVKVLDPAVASVVGPERFLREVDLASKLSHPHILPIFAAGEANGLLYYVMPYVPGDTLRDRILRERRLAVDVALQIAREIADALSYAHARGIVHRDIKPENILLEAGHAIVADFGVARGIAPAQDATITETGSVVGTPAYMSPEQWTGTDPVDGRADIYSLGCVLYEMLVGEAPKFYEPVSRPSLLRPGVPPDVDRALAIALARTPADRFAAADDFRAALRLPPSGESAAVGLMSSAPSGPPQEPRRTAVVTPRRGAAQSRVPALLATRPGLLTLVAGLFAVNWLQTVIDNRLGAGREAMLRLRHQFSHAMRWIEGGRSFAGHDATNALAAYGYAAVYFFLFPALLLLTAVGLARRAAVGPLRALVMAGVIDYAISVPFFVLMPVPERWSVSGSGAVLLSDRWTSRLIEIVRPISGLDNCFPSFHVSLTVIAVLACFLFGLPFRWSALVAGAAVVLSTFVLGIHWTADIVAGGAVAVISMAVALRLERFWAASQGSTFVGQTTAAAAAAPAGRS